MGLDIRYPIGMMFAIIGALMIIVGVVTSSKPGMYACSLGININLIWGCLLLAFGVAMYIGAKRGTKADKAAADAAAKSGK
jgi:hypothetical protein